MKYETGLYERRIFNIFMTVVEEKLDGYSITKSNSKGIRFQVFEATDSDISLLESFEQRYEHFIIEE